MQAYDPLQPINSINTYEAPDRQSTALDDPSALRYNSIIREERCTKCYQHPGIAKKGGDLTTFSKECFRLLRSLLLSNQPEC